MLRRPLAALPVAIAIAIVPGAPASAQSSADVAAARELFVEGSQLAEEGKWEDARDRYERSLKLKYAALTLYNVGVAEQHTGRLVDAMESFRAFLAQPADPSTSAYVDPVRATVASLERRVGRLAIDVRPVNAAELSVKVDGREVPLIALDRKRLVDPGAHAIVVEARGYKPAHAAATLAEGGTANVTVLLEPAPPPPKRGRGLPTGLVVGGLGVFVFGEVVATIGMREGLDSAQSGDVDQAKKTILVGNVVAGVGLAAAGAGLVMLLSRMPHD